MKDIVAVTGKYMKGNEEKAEFTKIGAIGVSQSGKEYVILDPSISLSGVLAKQNALAIQEGNAQRATIMCSVFDKGQNQQPQQQPPQMQQQAPQQQPPQMQQQAPQQQPPQMQQQAPQQQPPQMQQQ
uniref:hypothetical protein n=1 Tax=Pseudoalteromonas sp. TaxID=53249 RepID=UPI003564462B